MGFISKNLSSQFYALGEIIARNPKYFIVIPLVTAVFLAMGLTELKFISDMEFLYSKAYSVAKMDRDFIETIFPLNATHKFNPSRATRIERFTRLIVSVKDEGDLLRSSVWDELMNLDALVRSVAIYDRQEDKYLNYSKLCAKWNDECFENSHLEIGNLIDSIHNETFRLSYPIVFHPQSYKTHIMPQYFGSMNLSKVSRTIEHIGAISLYYFTAGDKTTDDLRVGTWEVELARKLDETTNSWKKLKVSYLTLKTFEKEIDNNFFAVLEMQPHIVVVGVFFTVLTTMMTDCVKSKPWLGIMALVSALIASLASGGFLCFIGVPLCGMAITVPLLMLGIGVDDMFVMLASWRQTSPEHSVPKRLAECYSEAAVSITITSLTDMLGFYIGYFTPIPTIQIFSIYAGTGVLFIYIMHISFFGGVMAISGYHEAENRHSFFWWMRATPKSKADNISTFGRIFFTGGIDKSDPNNPRNNGESFAMLFFRDNFSQFIRNKYVKILVVLTFAAYIITSFVGISQMKEGLKIERIVRQDSKLQEFFLQQNLHFKKYPFRIQVVITSPLDYSSKSDQNKVLKLLKKIQNFTFVAEEYSENWLRDFIRFVDSYEELYETNIVTEAEFMKLLHDKYLTDKNVFSLDVAFNKNKTKILASRYILQVKNVLDFCEKKLLIGLRKIIAAEKELEVTIYHPEFIFTERNLIIRELAIKLILMAVVVMLIVSILFIPSLVCCGCVLFSILSIQLGVLGFMTLWGVNLDIISIILLLMCIGFSVDFSAHVSYAYISGNGNTSEKRVASAMYSLGLPIIQGAVSTILAVILLQYVPSYSYQTTFKIVFLVIAFATWHALFLLPVLLSIFRPENGLFSSKKSYTL